MNKFLGIKVEFEGCVYKAEGDKLYTRMFGTTGPNQKPHWSWGEIDKTSQLGRKVFEYIESI